MQPTEVKYWSYNYYLLIVCNSPQELYWLTMEHNGLEDTNSLLSRIDPNCTFQDRQRLYNVLHSSAVRFKTLEHKC